MTNGGGGGWRPSTLVAACLIISLFYYLSSLDSPSSTNTTTTDHSRTRFSQSTCSSRASTLGIQGSVYDLPGTLTTHSRRLDGNLSGDSIPVWKPFDHSNLNDNSAQGEHGRLLESLFLSVNSHKSTSEGGGRRLIDPLGGEEKEEEVSTILFFGDSNERSIVDELCLKFGVWPKIYSTKQPPNRSEMWHSDSHVCEIEHEEGGGEKKKLLRLISFMSYGVLIEKNSKLWEKKLELDEGPWSVEERIELAKNFVEKMGWKKIDLIVFNSNLWDLMYLHDTHLLSKTDYEFSLSLSTLDTYISRTVIALTELRQAFPETKKMSLRTLHPLHPGRSIDFFNSRRIVQINQATLEVLRRINDHNKEEEAEEVRLLDLGKVLQGWPTVKGEEFNILKDKVHLDWNPGLWMYGEMVLDALYR
ncbi:hypothetical protein JCM3765_003506 [Sporobolomyces pararoseus]